MPGPWISDATLKQKVADVLKKDVGDLDPYWDRFVAEANAAATNDIMEILLGKGYTLGQIDAWDSRTTYNIDIALYHALVKGAALADYNQETVDKLDRRKRLEEQAALLINGALVQPGAADTGGGAAGGVIDDTNYRINMSTKL